MSANDLLLNALSKLLEDHGQAAVLLALRDGCDAFADNLGSLSSKRHAAYWLASGCLKRAADALKEESPEGLISGLAILSVADPEDR